MNYDQLKIRLEKLSRNGQLFDNVKIDQATTIIDHKLFLKTHFNAIEEGRRKKEYGEKYNMHLYTPVFARLKKFLEISEKNIQEIK